MGGGGLTRGSSRSLLGCGTSSTWLNFPLPYLRILPPVVEPEEPYEPLFSDMNMTGGSLISFPEDAAVPGLVGGFMPNGI